MQRTPAERRLILLGATGSIGRSTIDVVRHLRSSGGPHFKVVGLAAGRSADALAELAREFHADAPALALADELVDPKSRDALLALSASGLALHEGPDAALRLIESVARPGDFVMAAMVGFAGLAPTLAAIERGCSIGLANKETLVAAGSLVTSAARRKGVALLPVDSEHSAILQCLPPEPTRGIRRIVITASGGPFRTWSAERIATAPIEAALKHPTWAMGSKITIDSATMMNKALEVIEAHWLFGLPADDIEVVVHPQSIVHGFVEFQDGSVLAQLSPPDMRLPIQIALTHPERLLGKTERLPFHTLRSLDFEAPDPRRFPAVRLGHRVIEMGGTAGAIVNGANEEAVAAYLRGAIAFGRISELAAEALDSISIETMTSLADAERADRHAREFVRARTATVSPTESPAWTP
ncbi:MAG: 1-deoxy-D-xylulose-5-phosphate reductoisomerase [Phycisphaeraceae bacterium]|nr:1-deoxy-D-xylulose-5-phosphate reductoisomerase [Phycisphaeraceae bacterium]